MALVDSIGAWEHSGFFFAMESTWGTKIVSVASGDWYKLRDTEFVLPDIMQPRTRVITGSGVPGPEATDVIDGAPGMPPFTTTHPMTLKNAAWLFGSLANGNILGEGANDAWARHDSPSPVLAATLLGKIAAGSKTYYGVSCNVSQIDVTMPAGEGGTSSGLCTLAATWIGQTAIGDQAAQVVHATHAGDDDGAQLLTGNCELYAVAISQPTGNTLPTVAAAGFVSANLSFTNGYTLHPPSGSGLALGATYGRADVTGSVTVMGDLTAATADTVLRAAYEAGTHILLAFRFTEDANEFIIPCIIGKPTRSEIAGFLAWTYPIEYVEDAVQTEATIEGYAWAYYNSAADGAPWDVDA